MRSAAEMRMRESECETLWHLKNNSSSSSEAKIRAVYLLRIEKHQHAASSPLPLITFLTHDALLRVGGVATR